MPASSAYAETARSKRARLIATREFLTSAGSRKGSTELLERSGGYGKARKRTLLRIPRRPFPSQKGFYGDPRTIPAYYESSGVVRSTKPHPAIGRRCFSKIPRPETPAKKRS